MGDWTEVADGVHHKRYNPLDVSIVVIEGEFGVLAVDTRSSPREADELIADISARFDKPIRWVVNTHAHYDHTFGNQRFGPFGLDVEVYGHRNIRRHFAQFEAPRLAAARRDPSREPGGQDWSEVTLTPPTHEVAERTTLNIGDRKVDLIPLRPGHTDTDLVLLVRDANTWVLGDIIEESGPPMYGSGSFPLGWPGVLEQLLEQMRPGDRMIPGHGQVVDRSFVVRQTAQLKLVADGIRDAHARGLSPDEALWERDDWPFPVDGVFWAFDRGLRQLDAPTEAR
ncbi:MBL fold metallo-hydrolase [Salinibacterium sp. ZJ454]|uniref:MBL fold metallo-hydrolase n=1 Tax=Salinibacterium sp. ZJ454 TaxID=2708339 RepID=UPI00141E2A7B|nr:MBL fold metallo-hydrolase [Salinibacterium sp. ZJ454]